MSESMATFQNAFYIGNNFNAILYGLSIRIPLSLNRIVS